MTLRALVVTPDFPPRHGGIQLLVHRLVANWQRLEPTVLTLDAPGARAFDREDGIRTVRVRTPVPLRRSSENGLLNLAAVAFALRRRPHVVLSSHVNVGPAAAALSRWLRVPYVQYGHGREIVARPRVARIAFANAAAVVAVSSFTRELAIAHGADPSLVEVIPPGVDLPSANGVERGRPTILAIARLRERYKGFDVLVRAMPLVRARVPDARLAVVGDGALRAPYERLAEALGLDDAVVFAGDVSDAERDAWLASAHVLAMPSRLTRGGAGEGFGIVALEAAAHGIPTVAGRAGGAVDAVVDGVTGLLVDPWDHVELAEALSRILRDRPEAEEMGRRAHDRATELSWQRIARQVEDVLLRVARA